MSLRGTIQRSDKGSLGADEEIMLRLLEAFPGTVFQYEPEEPPGLRGIRLPLLLRLWLLVFGAKDVPYPRHQGCFQRTGGGAVEFHFAAGDSVRTIIATSYGNTGGLDANFARLSEATGWTVSYPRF
jgi:hypothetical protein